MNVSSSRIERLLTGGACWRGARSVHAFDSILAHLPRDRVSMHAEHLGGVADVAFRSLKRARDEHLLELSPRIVVQNALFKKFLNELLELIAHGQRSSRPDRSRNASRYFSRVWRTTSSGSDGTGGCLFQRMRSR